MKRLPAVCVAVLLAACAGCNYDGPSSLPLPGGAGGGGYEVSMVFDDVTNLVPQETCRAGDVVVGSVERIELRDDLKAEVVCKIDPHVHLAGNAVPVIRETSLLGERFVALDPPAGAAPQGRLAPGAHLTEADAHVVPDVEIVLGALSQVLNGGGLANVETISHELSTALSGSDLGGTTRELEHLVGTLDDHKTDLVAALEAVDRLSAELARQRDVIGSALEVVPAGLAVLDRQLPRMVKLLHHLGAVSDVAVPLIRRTRADTVADLQMLAPTLDNLARSKSRLSRALEGIITFPFPSYTKYVTQGDYAGMFATMTLDLDSFNHLIAQQRGSSRTTAPPSTHATPSLPPLPTVPGVPGLSDLPDPGRLTGGALSPGTGVIHGTVTPTGPGSLAALLTGGLS